MSTLLAPHVTAPTVAIDHGYTLSGVPIPLVYAVRTKGGSQLTFWCPFCEARHIHGRPTGDMVRHRVAHCTVETSPYRQTGYMLVEVAAGDSRLTPTPRGRRPRRETVCGAL